MSQKSFFGHPWYFWALWALLGTFGHSEHFWALWAKVPREPKSAPSAQKCRCLKAPRVPKNVKKCPKRPKVPRMAKKCLELPNLKRFYHELFLGHPVVRCYLQPSPLVVFLMLQPFGFCYLGEKAPGFEYWKMLN